MRDSDSCYTFSVHSWKQERAGGSDTPSKRSGHCLVSEDNFLYLVGGFNDKYCDHNGIQQDFWSFNTITNKWRKVTPDDRDSSQLDVLSTQLASHAATVEDGLHPRLYLCGGTDYPFGLNLTSSIRIFSIKTNSWGKVELSKDASSSIYRPKALYGQSIVFDEQNSCIFTFGGTDGYTFYSDVNVLDLKVIRWRRLCFLNEQNWSTVPEGRYRQRMFKHGVHLFIFGGGTTHESFPLRQIPIFNVETCKWNTIESFPDMNHPQQYPPSRRCHAAVKMRNVVYIHGGTDGSQVFSDLWAFNLHSSTWTCISESCEADTQSSGMRKRISRLFHDATVIRDGKMFVFGGSRNTALTVRDNCLFSCWLTIPPLQRMAFEAVCFYIHLEKNQENDCSSRLTWLLPNLNRLPQPLLSNVYANMRR